jgi:hypothetical protein
MADRTEDDHERGVSVAQSGALSAAVSLRQAWQCDDSDLPVREARVVDMNNDLPGHDEVSFSLAARTVTTTDLTKEPLS